MPGRNRVTTVPAPGPLSKSSRIRSAAALCLLYTDDGEHTLDQVHERRIHITGAFVRRSSLEDVFLRLTGRTLVD